MAKRILPPKRKPRKGARIKPLVEHIAVSVSENTRRKCGYVPCGNPFKPKRYWQKFCSEKCRTEDWKARHPMIVVDPFK